MNKSDKPEVHTIIYSIEGCSDRFPAGRSREGYYIVADDVLSLTCPKGELAEDFDGRRYSQELKPTDDRNEIAKQLTEKLTAALNGKSRPRGFGGPRNPLNYPGRGWC
jgi:hypothetical protein